MNTFVVVTPMRNNSKHLRQMLLSLIAQSYQEWKCILIDDCSSEEELDGELSVVKSLNDDRIIFLKNSIRQWMTVNALSAIRMADSEDIIAQIDGDDYLCDLDTFKMIDQVYRQSDCEMLWTAQRWNAELPYRNISGPLPHDVNPYRHPWVTSHLKTFRKRIIDDVNEDNFRGSDGKYSRVADQAIYLPLLYKTQKRVFFPHVCYHYRIKLNDDNTVIINDHVLSLEAEANYLRTRGFIK